MHHLHTKNTYHFIYSQLDRHIIIIPLLSTFYAFFTFLLYYPNKMSWDWMSNQSLQGMIFIKFCFWCLAIFAANIDFIAGVVGFVVSFGFVWQSQNWPWLLRSLLSTLYTLLKTREEKGFTIILLPLLLPQIWRRHHIKRYKINPPSIFNPIHSTTIATNHSSQVNLQCLIE